MSRNSEPELLALASVLQEKDVHAVLGMLNSSTSFRFTGLYRFDGATLRNIALFDRWTPDQKAGADAPMAETFCAISGRMPRGLTVVDGASDPRFPWMQANAVKSYCGAPVRDATGRIIGTLCHFDLQPCEGTSTEIDRLEAVGPLVQRFFENGELKPGDLVQQGSRDSDRLLTVRQLSHDGKRADCYFFDPSGVKREVEIPIAELVRR